MSSPASNSLTFPSPFHASRLLQIPFEFPESYSKFPLAIYFTHANVNFQVTLSIHLTHSFPQNVSINLFFQCCPVNKFISTIFIDSIYMC